MQKKWFLISTGFALFSMFFGSGNLVFPISVGLQSEGHYLMGAFGILLTGVIVPFLGVFGMLLYRGEISQFFRMFGKKGVFLFSFLALALMGPFGVLARCLTVAHGALLLLFPHISLPLASGLMCLFIFFFTLHRHKIIATLGAILTPFLLASIAAIALFAFYQGTLPQITDQVSGSIAFKHGFFQGYQTMDLLAAFFFSQFVIKHLYETKKESALTLFIQSALIGGGLLALVYTALVLLGSIYAGDLINIPLEGMLGEIALKALGPFAAPLVCISVIFACLTTAIVLTSLFADFLHKEIAQKRINQPTSLVITLVIGFLVSILEFSGIAKFLGPILEMVYPGLIVLTVANIFTKWLERRKGITVKGLS